MSLMSKQTGGEFELCPAGTHYARNVQMIDLGGQYSEFYKKTHQKVLLGWELPGELKVDGTPFIVWRRYTNSLGENAHLRGHLESWRGRKFSTKELEGFSLTKILDCACMLTIVHDERDGRHYANVAQVAKLPKGTEMPDRVSDLIEFDLDRPNWESFNLLSEKLQETINSSAERRAAAVASGANGEPPVGGDRNDAQGSAPVADDDALPF